jgi:hypothetical protein
MAPDSGAPDAPRTAPREHAPGIELHAPEIELLAGAQVRPELFLGVASLARVTRVPGALPLRIPGERYLEAPIRPALGGGLRPGPDAMQDAHSADGLARRVDEYALDLGAARRLCLGRWG